MMALIMVFSFVACGDTTEPTVNTPPVEDNTADEPSTPANDFPGAVLTFEDVKDNGAVTIVWTLTLRVDGTFLLEENNPFAGATEHAGASYTVDGNTVTCNGLEPFEMSDIFNKDSFTATFNEQFFAPEGYELAEPVSDHLSDYQTVPGTYVYEAYKADFDFTIYWTLVLKDDGTFTLTEDNSMIQNIEEHEGASYEIDGDIVSLHGLNPFGMDDIFKKSDVVVICAEDMTFIPKEALSDNNSSSGSNQSEAVPGAGAYIFNDVKEGGMMTIVWSLELKDDGTFTLTEENPFAGASAHNGTGYTVNGDTVTLEGLEPFEMSDIFNVDTLTVKFNEVYFAPEGFDLEEVVVYTFEEEKADTGITLTWTLLLKGDGSFVLTEINPNFNDPKVYHGSEYEMDGNTVNCGHMEDGPAMGDWAVETNGFTVVIDPENLTFEPQVD